MRMRGGCGPVLGGERVERGADAAATRRRQARARRANAATSSAGARGVLARDRHGDHFARQPLEMGEEGRRCPWSTACRRSATSGRGDASSKSAIASASTRPPASLCAPSSQTSAPAGARSTSGPACSRCSRAGHCASRRPRSKRACGRSGATARSAAIAVGGVAVLMAAGAAAASADRAGRARPRRPAGRSRRARNSRGSATRRGDAEPHRLALDDRAAPRRSARRSIAGAPALRMPAFSKAILSTVAPRNSGWSIETGVMTVAAGRVDHVGRVEPAAEADFEQQIVGGRLG